MKWAQMYDEIIDISSARLAQLGFYTNRTDIARYNLTEQNGNVRGSILNGDHLAINRRFENIQFQIN